MNTRTFNYNCAKFLCDLLTPLFTNAGFSYIKDSFEFAALVRKKPLVTNGKMLSFDVESLFTNVPLEETIDIIIKKVYRDDNVKKVNTNLAPESMRELLKLCTKESHFLFNGKFYDQVDGVAKGSPLGPLFSIAFMLDFEERYVKELLNNKKVDTWLRYVDDVFCIINDQCDSKTLLQDLNTKHPSIKFTCEESVDNKLRFLDVLVTEDLVNNKFSTDLYVKPTNCG